jgi:hypothetical protein
VVNTAPSRAYTLKYPSAHDPANGRSNGLSTNRMARRDGIRRCLGEPESQTSELSFQTLAGVLVQHLTRANRHHGTVGSKSPTACQRYTGNSMRQKMPTTEAKICIFFFCFWPKSSASKKRLENEPKSQIRTHFISEEERLPVIQGRLASFLLFSVQQPLRDPVASNSHVSAAGDLDRPEQSGQSAPIPPCAGSTPSANISTIWDAGRCKPKYFPPLFCSVTDHLTSLSRISNLFRFFLLTSR